MFKKIYNTLDYYNTKANEAAHFIYIVGAGILDGVVNSSAQEKADFAVMVADPTGVTGHDFLKKQWKVAEDEVFKKGDLSYGTALMLVMAAMGALPVVSKLVKGGKLSMKVYNKALTKVSKAGPAGAKAAHKAKGAVDDVIKTSSKTATTGRTQKTARAAAKIKGLNPAFSPKTGKPYGVFVDKKGNAFVMVATEEGPVTFMYSSGTSMLVVNKSGNVVGAPRIWYPVKDLTPDGKHIKKFGLDDPRFGGGDKDLASRLLHHDPKFDDYMRDSFGFNWPQMARDPEAHFIRRVIKKAQKQGVFQNPGLAPGSKYPDPSSYFGQVGKKIGQVSADGKVSKELVDYFGPVVKGDYNKWRRGLGG